MIIVEELNKIRDRRGYLPEADLKALAERLSVPLYRVEEVVSFFPHYRKTAPPQVEINVCVDMACNLAGAEQLITDLNAQLKPEIAANKASVCGVSCLGRCDRAVAARIHKNHVEDSAHSRPPGNHDEHEHAAHQYLGRPAAHIVAGAKHLLKSDDAPTGEAKPNTDVELPIDSSKWEINRLYQQWPKRPENYQAAARSIAAALAKKNSTDAAAAEELAQRYKAVVQIAGAMHAGLLDANRKEIVQQKVKNAVLLGMGGAGGQAFKKWQEVSEALIERRQTESEACSYVVCNADESEPGTFKDRELMLRTPHLVVEGVIIAGLMVGAKRGWIYVRHEYEECIAELRREIAWAQEHGFCGDDILGTGVSFPVEVFVSPGGYICGEATALIQAMEDKRAEPRVRPPELQTNGLWDMPTLVNNVETLAWAPAIVMAPRITSEAEPCAEMLTTGNLRCDAPATSFSTYARYGRPIVKDSLAWKLTAGDKKWIERHGAAAIFPGQRFFSISGHVKKPGVYEVPCGIPLGELLNSEKYCGGILGGEENLLAVALSGPSGGFTPRMVPLNIVLSKNKLPLVGSQTHMDVLDFPLHVNMARQFVNLELQVGLALGAAIVVYAKSHQGKPVDMLREAVNCLRFYVRETCGKCVPCRVGGKRLLQMAEEMAKSPGWLEPKERKQLCDELCRTIIGTSICGLGQSVPKPLTTWQKFFASRT